MATFDNLSLAGYMTRDTGLLRSVARGWLIKSLAHFNNWVGQE